MPCGLSFGYIRARLGARKRLREERDGANGSNPAKKSNNLKPASESDKPRASILGERLPDAKRSLRISHPHVQTNSSQNSQQNSEPSQECQHLRPDSNPHKWHQKSLLIRQSHTSQGSRVNSNSKSSTTFTVTRPPSSRTQQNWRSRNTLP